MTTAITPQAPGGALEDYSELDGYELPSDGSDVEAKFPTLRLVQGTTRVDGAEKHGGEFYRDDTGEFIGGPKAVLLQIQANRALFGEEEIPLCSSPDGIAPRPGGRVWEDGQFTPRGVSEPLQLPHGEPASCATCILGQFVGGKAPYCSEGYLSLLDLAGNPQDPDFVKFQASRTALKALRTFLGAAKATRLRGMRRIGAPAYAFTLTLSSKVENVGGKKWNQLIVKWEQLPPAKVLAYAGLVRAIRGDFQAEAAAAPVAHDEPAPEAAPAWGDGTDEFGGV